MYGEKMKKIKKKKNKVKEDKIGFKEDNSVEIEY